VKADFKITHGCDLNRKSTELINAGKKLITSNGGAPNRGQSSKSTIADATNAGNTTAADSANQDNEIDEGLYVDEEVEPFIEPQLLSKLKFQ
jgi:hypothetical protein